MRIFALVASIVISSTFLVVQHGAVAAESTRDWQQSNGINTGELDESELAKLLETEKSSAIRTLLQSEEDTTAVLSDAVNGDEDDVEIEPVEHKIERGDTLISIGDAYDVDWLRIWAKNDQLDHPDTISIGDTLVIPFDDEQIDDRELPEPEAVEMHAPVQSQSDPLTSAPQPGQAQTTQSAQPNQPRGSSSGNLYVAGNCTWYAKDRRPDLPNNLGNADTWIARARAQGIPTGSQPRVGAVGQQGMHVVYVEAIHSDGTVTVSEMNWHGLHVISERRVAASNFQYIY